MDLVQYIFKHKMGMREFSKKVGVSVSYLNAIRNGGLFPSEEIAKKIEIGTNGEVKAEDLRKKVK